MSGLKKILYFLAPYLHPYIYIFFQTNNAAHSLPLKNNMISDNMSAFDIEAADDEDETFENMYAFEYPELPICSLCNNLTTANCHHTGLGMTKVTNFKVFRIIIFKSNCDFLVGKGRKMV